MTTHPRHSLALVFAFALAACGTPPAPASPSAPSASAPVAPAPPPPATSASAERAPAPTPPPAPTPSKPARKPSEILTQPDVTFFLSFADSDPGKAAEKQCEAEAAGDPSKMSPCMDRARAKVQTHAVRLTQDAAKHWWWQTMQKNGSRYLILHKVMVDLGEETDKTITIKPKGKDQGMAPWGLVPKELTIEIVDDFTIAVQDPQQGRLVLEARIGAMN